MNSTAPRSTDLPSRICVSIGCGSTQQLLEQAHIEAERGESLFEFCLEFLADPREGPAAVGEFMRARPSAWIIATCRRNEHNFHGTIAEQLALLAASVDAGARCIDLEIETAEHQHAWLRALGDRCLRIVSYHNYSECPPLSPILRKLKSTPADLFKIAATARTAGATRRLMEAAQSCDGPNLILAMGSNGLATRILGPVLGRSFTYVPPAGHCATAPGQIDAGVLRRTYRIDELNRKSLFIAGDSRASEESLSPEAYNEALTKAGSSAVYLPLHSSDLRTLLGKNRGPVRYCGAVVAPGTGRRAITLAERITATARHGGLIDTLWKEHGRWYGGWNLGESVLAQVRSIAGGRKISVRVSGRGSNLRKLLRRAGYPELRSRDEIVIRPGESVASADLTIPWTAVERNLMRRQVECWLRGQRGGDLNT